MPYARPARWQLKQEHGKVRARVDAWPDPVPKPIQKEVRGWQYQFRLRLIVSHSMFFFQPLSWVIATIQLCIHNQVKEGRGHVPLGRWNCCFMTRAWWSRWHIVNVFIILNSFVIGFDFMFPTAKLQVWGKMKMELSWWYKNEHLLKIWFSWSGKGLEQMFFTSSKEQPNSQHLRAERYWGKLQIKQNSFVRQGKVKLTHTAAPNTEQTCEVAPGLGRDLESELTSVCNTGRS